MIQLTDTNELRRKLCSDDLIDHVDIHANVKPVLTELLARIETAEKELAELRSSMKFRTSLIGRTEAERDALRAAVRHEADCVEACKSEIERLRANIEAMKQQEPFDADSDVFRSAFEAALKAGNWPATRQGDGYRSPSTQIAWRIAFSTVNRLKLYALPGAKGEQK